MAYYRRPMLRVHVRATTRRKAYTKLIPDKGAPGRTPASKRWFEPMGNLQGWNKGMHVAPRRRILSHMVRTQGYATVVRKLNALRNVTVDRETKHAAEMDMEWLRRKYRPEN